MSSILERIIMNSGFDLDVRWSHLATEGTKKELVYPQNLLGFIRFPDLEVQENVYRTYNEYLALLQREKAGLFYGVGVCSNWWDPAKAEDAIRQIVDLGLKTYMIPITPGKDANGNTLNYTSAEMDRLWSVAEEAGLPVAFHTGESASFEGRGGFARNFVVAISPYRKTFSELVFGGIFDRHPALRIVFAEAGMAWVPSVLQDSELTFEVHRDVFDIKPKLRPSEYWHKHCYASFQIDPVGLELLKYVGADRVMWAADYPHSEGTFGFTWDSMNAVIDATSETDARKILGDTATELFQL
jgi:predicted TIM-barrel fold metal-dependent hydrolase